MASNNVGTVTVEIVADATKFEKDLPKAVDSATTKAEKPGEKGGNKIGDAIGKGTAFTLKAAGGLIAAAFGSSLVKGFQRLQQIDQAEATLKGLGNTAEEVASISAQALAAVDKTAFGLGESTQLAAKFMTAGVEAGTDLAQALDLTVDAA